MARCPIFIFGSYVINTPQLIQTDEQLTAVIHLTYLLGPESNPDSNTWRTELNRPLNK